MVGHLSHFANSKFGEENWLESRRHSKQPRTGYLFGSLLFNEKPKFPTNSFLLLLCLLFSLNAVQVVQQNGFWKITFDVKYWNYNRIFDLLSETTITQISSFEMFAGYLLVSPLEFHSAWWSSLFSLILSQDLLSFKWLFFNKILSAWMQLISCFMLCWSTNIFVNFTFSIRLLTVGCHDVGLDSSAVIFYKITLWYFYYTCKDIYCVFHFTKYLPNYRNDKIVNNSPSTCLEWMLFKMWYQQWLVHISPHCVSARAWNVISYWDISQTLTIFI